MLLLHQGEQAADGAGRGDDHPGVLFDQAYDLTTLTPIPEWEKMVRDAKKELRTLGLSAL